MRRYEALEVLAEQKGDSVSVATMRSIVDWYHIGAAPDMNLDNRGCMGAAASFGLGIAMAQPERKVMVIDGDGSYIGFVTAKHGCIKSIFFNVPNFR